ncbi:MAG: DUF2807 domain-containing protein [Caulobacter sp.]|nr:DUF2807 domain-containing protein [Caulobacter sp.]
MRRAAKSGIITALLGLAVLSAATASASGASAAERSVQIKSAVARVIVVPSDRQDVKVVIRTQHPDLPLKVSRKGDTLVIDGDLRWNRIRNCRGAGEKASVDVKGVGTVSWARMPEVIIYSPRKVDMSVAGAVFGSIGRANSVEFANAGCGDWTIANVAGRLDISQAGSGNVQAGSVGALDLSVAGSGDTRTQAVTGRADINIAGSGDVRMARLDGPLDVSIAGSGDIRVYGGKTGKVDVSIAGSGDVRIAGEAASVDASFMGSGDVWVTKVNGPVSKSVMGSGGVHVGPFDMNRN